MNRLSLILGLIFSLIATGYIHNLDPRHPLVVNLARTIKLAQINSELAAIKSRGFITGKTDYARSGALYLAKGWIEGPEIWTQARAALYRGALEGDTDAVYAYAILNLTGIGGRKDVDTAIAYLKKAALSGHRNAHWQLGNLYLSPALYNVDEATRWLARAFRLGDVRAFALLVMINPSRTRTA